jgi:hypothetical protein
MTLRDPRPVAGARLFTALAMIAGVVLTATGSATVTGLLPYFTIQTNIGYGVFAGWFAIRAWRGDLRTPPVLKGAVTLYIVITGLVYHLVLANPASPFAMTGVHRTPAEAIGNQLLHTVVPLMAVLDWLIFDARRRYRWAHALWWLAYPLGYLGFALVRGLIVDSYPYPFIDVNDLGYRGVAITSVIFAVAFWLLGLLFVAGDRLPGRRDPAPDPVGAEELQQVARRRGSVRSRGSG